MDNPKYARVQSYGSMTTSPSEDDMTVHSRLFPYQKKMVVEREVLYEEENPPFQPLLVTSRMFGEARSTCLLVPYIFFYVLFLMLGAVVFNLLEEPIDIQTRVEVIQAKEDFMTRHPDVLGNIYYFYFIKRLFVTPYLLIRRIITNSFMEKVNKFTFTSNILAKYEVMRRLR